MARPLTAKEQSFAQQVWPLMNVTNIIVTDEITPRYNCIAWTLGITTSWIWPWGPGKPSKAEFDVFYQGQGFTPAGSGPLAAFGVSPSEMTHGSISGSGHGLRWESKCGVWLRIQHGLAEMEGGTLYGTVLGFYSPISAGKAINAVEDMKRISLSRKDLKFLKDRAEQIAPGLRAHFEQVYTSWKQACQHPLILIDSNPASRTQTPEFLEVLSLGAGILPLLMEKLADPEEFFALQIVDRLLRPQFVLRRAADDPAVLLGEQGRAVETAKEWIRREA